MIKFQKALEFRHLAWNPHGRYLGYVWATVTAGAHTVRKVPVGQELPTPFCESASPLQIPPSFPDIAGASHQVSQVRLSAPGYPGCCLLVTLSFSTILLDRLVQGYHSSQESLCERVGVWYVLLILLVLACVKPKLNEDETACREGTAETHLSTLIRVELLISDGSLLCSIFFCWAIVRALYMLFLIAFSVFIAAALKQNSLKIWVRWKWGWESTAVTG